MRSACAVFFCLLALTSVASAQSFQQGYLTIAESIFSQVGLKLDWAAAKNCVTVTDDVIRHLFDAIRALDVHESNKTLEGLASLSKAFQILPEAEWACLSHPVNKMNSVLYSALQTLEKPTSFFYNETSRQIKVNGYDISQEINSALNDFSAGNLSSMGKNIANAVLIVSGNPIPSSMVRSRPQNLTFSLADFENVALGVLEGIGAAENWTELQPCISSTEDAVENIEKAIQYLQKEDTIDVAYGLAALAKALEDLPTAIGSCGALVSDVEKLVDSLAAISSPTTFIYKVAKNMIVNGVDIYHEISDAVDTFKAGNWEKFGFNVGEALAKIFLYGTPSRKLGSSSVDDVLLFLKGTIEGISTDPIYDQIAPCILNASSIAVLLDQAVNDFVSEETERVLEGVAVLGEALYAVPTAMKECGVAYSQLQKLLDAVHQLENPRSIIYHIAKSLVINGMEIWDKITDATTNINGGNYEQAGKSIGAILAALIDPDSAVSGHLFTKHVEKVASFKVDHNHKFVNWTRAELKSLFGTQLQKPEDSKIPVVNTDGLRADLPVNFSSYTQWPECEHAILDQAHCGSCWAFGAAETLSDRFCIASGGQVKVTLSPQYLVSCSTFNMGCNGGMLTAAWASLERSGLPTLDCTPYASQNGTSPSCDDIEKGCTDGSSLKRYYAKSWSTRWYMSADSIKTEIFANGPVESAFTVYEDFMSYKGGVYKHTTGAELGGHAIKIVGWGNEDGQDYWLVANSWGTSWGENGYFKMAIGSSSMDSNGVVGQADVNNLPTSFPREFLTY